MFTPEARAKALATQQANRERKAAGLPPLGGKPKTKRRASRSQPSITLTPPPGQTGPAPQALGDPGESPAQKIHQTLLIVFGPINYLLHRAGGFDLTEEEFNLIFTPLERIIVRHGLSASGEIPPDLFDGIQCAIGVMTYGIRLGPQIAAKRAASGGAGGGRRAPGPGAGGGQSGNGQGAHPGATGGVAGNPWASLTPESIFNDVGVAPAPVAGNGHLQPVGAHPVQPGSTGQPGE